jgi:hypothetical protein
MLSERLPAQLHDANCHLGVLMQELAMWVGIGGVAVGEGGGWKVRGDVVTHICSAVLDAFAHDDKACLLEQPLENTREEFWCGLPWLGVCKFDSFASLAVLQRIRESVIPRQFQFLKLQMSTIINVQQFRTCRQGIGAQSAHREQYLAAMHACLADGPRGPRCPRLPSPPQLPLQSCQAPSRFGMQSARKKFHVQSLSMIQGLLMQGIGAESARREQHPAAKHAGIADNAPRR